MEYFTRQITLQDRLKQHECQLYPLIGSCLELRDDSPEGCYQESPLDLSHRGLVKPTGRSLTPETDRVRPAGRSSSPETGRVRPTGRPLSPETSRRVPTDTSSSKRSNEPPHIDKYSSAGIKTSVQTHNCLQSGNQDQVLVSNSEEGVTLINGQPERQSKHEQDTIKIHTHCDETVDVMNPLLKQVLESEEPIVSEKITTKDTQDLNGMLHHVRHIHESDSSLQNDHGDKQSSSTTNSHRDPVLKQQNTSITDHHKSKSNGLEHNSVMAKSQGHNVHSFKTDDHESIYESNSTMTDIKQQKPSNTDVKGIINSNKTIPKHVYSRKRGRFVSAGITPAYLPNVKKLCDSTVCPNVNVTDFTHQFLNDKNRHRGLSNNAINCEQLCPKADLNFFVPWAGENNDQLSRGHPSNQTIRLVSSSVSHSRNTSGEEQRSQRPLVVDTSPKCAPPPLLSLKSGRSELGPNQSLYPCSQPNSMAQHPQHPNLQQQHLTKHTLHTPSAAISYTNSFRLTAPLDLSTKTMYSKKQANHAYNSVSEETRIKEISDNLRAQLVGQSTNAPHSCPGICLGHAVKGGTTSKLMSSHQHKRLHNADQTSIIIERQVLFNLHLQQLLNTDSKTSQKVDEEIPTCESLTADLIKLPKRDGQESLSIDQRRTHSVDTKTTPNIGHKRSPDDDQVTVTALNNLQRSTEVSNNMSTDNDRKMVPRKEQSPPAVATCKECEQNDASGSTLSITDGLNNDRTSRSMAWNISVSKTIGLHSDCNNCKACRRISAKLSIPPIEENVTSKQPNIG